MSRVTVTEENAIVQIDSDTNEVVVSAFGPQGPSIGVAAIDEGDGITITGSAPQTIALTPGTKSRVPLLWDGDSWQNKAAEHSRIVSAHTDDHHRYVDREISVENRNVIQPQADVVALDVRELSNTQTSPMQLWSGPDGSQYAAMTRDGLTMFGSVTFDTTGVSFQGLVEGLPQSSGRLWIGNASNLAQERLISGDATLSNAGVLTLAASGVSAGTHTKVTVDAKGRVTAGANLSSGDLPSHNHAASDITTGTVPTARLGSGTADATTFLRGDQTWAAPPAGFTNPMTTLGDLIVGGASGVATRLAVGASGRVVRSDGTNASWAVLGHSDLSGLTSGNPHTQYVYNAPSAGSLQNIISAALGNHENLLVVQQSDPSTFAGSGDLAYFGVWRYGGTNPAWMLFNNEGVFQQVRQTVPLRMYNAAGTFYSEISVGTLASNVAFQLPTNNGTNGQVLTTNGSGVTSWTTVSGGGGFSNPMTTNGDLITQTGGSPARLAIGAANTVLASNGSAASWVSLTIGGSASVSGTNTGDQTTVSGNAGTATALQTARNINGVSFNGTADITVPAAAGTLTGSSLAAGVTGSSLTSLGTIGTGVWQGSTIGLAYGGTNANLSATGGTGQVLRQSSVGGAVSVGTLAHSEVTGLTTGDPHTQYLTLTPSVNTRNVITGPNSLDEGLRINAGTDFSVASSVARLTSWYDDANNEIASVAFDPAVGWGLRIASNSVLVLAGGGAGSPSAIFGGQNGTFNGGTISLGAGSNGNGGVITVAGGASASGGNINTSNGGGNITTNGAAGSIGLGVAATRTTLQGSGTAAVTVTIPAIAGQTAILSAAQSSTGGTGHLLKQNSAGAAITVGALSASEVPNLDADKITTGTIATARLGSGTANSGTFLRGDNTWAAAGGGGGNAVIATVDFGVTTTDRASVVVTGQAWVTSTSAIVVTPLVPAGVDPDELGLLDFKCVISNRVAGVGFTLTVFSETEATGSYDFSCMGV